MKNNYKFIILTIKYPESSILIQDYISVTLSVKN